MFKKAYIYITRVLFIVILVLILTVLYVLSFYSYRENNHADCAVVFGAAVWPGYFGPVASHALADRTLTAVDLYKSKQADCIVLTGANSIYGAHEVDIMTDLVLKEGVPEDVIELDRDGTNTLTSIEHLDTTRTYLLVSNDFHLARIHLLAKRVGTKHRLFAAQYGRGSGLHGMSARYSRESYFIIREVFAWWYYFFATLL